MRGFHYGCRLVDMRDKQDPWRVMAIHKRVTIENGRMQSVFGPGSKSLKDLRSAYDRIAIARCVAMGYRKVPAPRVIVGQIYVNGLPYTSAGTVTGTWTSS